MNAHETVCQSTPILLNSKISEQARSLLPPSIQLSSPTPRQLSPQQEPETTNRVATLNPTIVFKSQASRASVLAPEEQRPTTKWDSGRLPNQSAPQSEKNIKPQQASERNSMKHQTTVVTQLYSQNPTGWASKRNLTTKRNGVRALEATKWRFCGTRRVR